MTVRLGVGGKVECVPCVVVVVGDDIDDDIEKALSVSR